MEEQRFSKHKAKHRTFKEIPSTHCLYMLLQIIHNKQVSQPSTASHLSPTCKQHTQPTVLQPLYPYITDTQTSVLNQLSREGVGRFVGIKHVEDTMRTQPRESAKQGSQGFKVTEVTITEPVQVCSRSSAYMLWLCSWVFFWDS